MQERLIEETEGLIEGLSNLQEARRLASSVPIVRTAPVDELEAGLRRNSVGMAIAFNTKNIYGGTVSGAEKAARRKRGKATRNARKLHRGNR